VGEVQRRIFLCFTFHLTVGREGFTVFYTSTIHLPRNWIKCLIQVPLKTFLYLLQVFVLISMRAENKANNLVPSVLNFNLYM